MLNYARLETGSVRFELDRLSLDAGIPTAESLMAPQLQASGAALLLRRLLTGPASCSPIAEKLQQILLNLLANAIEVHRSEAARSPSTREVMAVPRTSSVRDTGVGIPADKLEAIFEPFVQVDSRYTRTRDGVGLGLAISRDLARGMGGDLSVESTLGVGSTFTLTLPLAAQR